MLPTNERSRQASGLDFIPHCIERYRPVWKSNFDRVFKANKRVLVDIGKCHVEAPRSGISAFDLVFSKNHLIVRRHRRDAGLGNFRSRIVSFRFVSYISA